MLWAYSTLRIYSPELYSAVSTVVVTLLQTRTSMPIIPGVLGWLDGAAQGVESITRRHLPWLLCRWHINVCIDST